MVSWGMNLVSTLENTVSVGIAAFIVYILYSCIYKAIVFVS